MIGQVPEPGDTGMSDAASKPWPTELRLHKDRRRRPVAVLF